MIEFAAHVIKWFDRNKNNNQNAWVIGCCAVQNMKMNLSEFEQTKYRMKTTIQPRFVLY